MGTCVKIVVAPGTTVSPVLVLPTIAARTASPINGAAENDNHIYMTIIIITFNLTKRLVYNIYYVFSENCIFVQLNLFISKLMGPLQNVDLSEIRLIRLFKSIQKCFDK
jgi:hypothetical protein